MLEDKSRIEEYISFSRDNGVNRRGLEIVKEIITNPPARRIRTRSMGKNITSRFPSRKMGFTVQAESWTLEWASIFLKEFDPLVLGYWDQPYHKANLVYRSGTRKVRVNSTLDCFVISKEFIGFEECKLSSELASLSKINPTRYHWNDELGCYEIPPLEAYLEGTGLGYRVVTDKEINPIYVNNLSHLYDYLTLQATADDKRLWFKCSELLLSSGPMEMSKLQANVGGVSRELLLQAIAQKVLFMDLEVGSLSNPEEVLVAASLDQLNHGRDRKAVEICSDRNIPLDTSEDIEKGLLRTRAVKSALSGSNQKEVAEKCGVTLRTLQRWIKAYRKDGMDGLRSKDKDKGNYTSRLPQAVESIIEEIFESNYMTTDNQNFSHIYSLICGRCREDNLAKPSKNVVRKRLDVLNDVQMKLRREGSKSAYQLTHYQGVEAMHQELPLVDIKRYLQRCHMDHTQIDLQMVSVEGANLGKPWLTTIVDEFSGLVLSAYLSFNSPSSVSVMSAIRLMVKNHGVMPEAIVVDGGKEFQSIYFESLMARYCVSVISREGKPRAGSAVERTYGSFNTILLDNLTGNNKLAKNIRGLSASHHPKNLAIWEPVEFYKGLCEFVDSFNRQSVKAGGLSPEAIRDKSIERFGLSRARTVKFDEAFLRHVLLPPKRKGSILRRNSSIQINRVNYWHVCLKSIPREGCPVEIRCDPFNLNHIFVYCQKKWLTFQATKPQHRNVDELDGAILAEVARHSLYLNEKARESSRVDLGLKVEALNQGAKSRHRERENSRSISDSDDCKSTRNSEFFDISEEVENKDGWGAIGWDTVIPGKDL